MNQEFLFGAYFAGGVITLLALMYIFAKNNILFSFVREGTAKAVLYFGKFHHFLMTYEGYGFDQRWSVQELTQKNQQGEDKSRENIEVEIKDEDDKPIDIYKVNFRKKPFHIGGLYWIGLPFINTIHNYEFRWTAFEQGEKDGKITEKAIHHKEVIDYILVQDDVYYTTLREAETSGMVQVDVELLFTARIINPYKALFRVQNWIETVQNLLKNMLRAYIAAKSFEELIKSEKRNLNREVDDFLLATKINNYLERTYGVRLKRVGLVHIDPAGERAKNYVESAAKQWEAEREAERIKTLANAEVGRMEAVYETVKKYGDVGLFLKGTEAMQEIGKGPSNLVMFPMGSARDLLQAVIGKKKGGS